MTTIWQSDIVDDRGLPIQNNTIMAQLWRDLIQWSFAVISTTEILNDIVRIQANILWELLIITGSSLPWWSGRYRIVKQLKYNISACWRGPSMARDELAMRVAVNSTHGQLDTTRHTI